MAREENFEPGAVVVPAQDGLLAQLGYNIAELDLDALGVVIERGSRRALVNFPEIAKTLWIDLVELADVFQRAKEGDAPYLSLVPQADEAVASQKLVWLLSWLMRELSLVEVLELELGRLEEIWDPCPGEKLEMYFAGDLETPSCRLSLGLSAFTPDQQAQCKRILGERLLFTQLKPAGMHKFEVAFYLQRFPKP